MSFLKRSNLVFLLTFPALLSANSASSPTNFLSEAFKEEWETKEFEGQTRYVWAQENGETILQAQSNSSASGLFLEHSVKLNEHPFINWSWQIKQALPALNETSKSGDDYVARIYVIVNDGWFFWQTKAINYVWSSRDAVTESWPNAYAPNNAIMIPLQSSQSKAGQWYTEKRNVADDFKREFGIEPEEIRAIAIMTDTDNSGLEASAKYKNLFFSRE